MYYKEGYDLAFQNAKVLFKIANNAFFEGAYGLACSLNILSSEEVLKASFLLIKQHHPSGKINEFENIFHKHKIKHQQLKDYVELEARMQSELKEFVNTYLPIVNFLEEMREDGDIPFNKEDELTELKKNIELFKRHSELSLNIDGILGWLEDANTNKNKGFYVDRTREGWSSPIEVSKEKFETERKYTEAFMQYLENMEELFKVYSEAKNLS